jgi:hypothetical protein
MKRRKTVSVTPAMGASTVAGAISTPPIRTEAGTGVGPATTWAEEAGVAPASAELSHPFFM